ncbi:MAG: TRAP transporter small permease subunit [Paracoccaceae bacterium]|nr:TRAP transporter small permease subunit [Paracoccaceae bacterium]
MPSLEFTLPHWLYWVGLVVFPIAAMFLARKARPEKTTYGAPLGYLILVTGGMLGLHRFYLKNLWGLLFIPVFILILIGNAGERDARSAWSDASNMVRVAERTIDRELPRVASAEAEIPDLKAEIDSTEAGSFARRSAERRLDRANERVIQGQERIAKAQAEIVEFTPITKEAADLRAFWSNTARYAFFILVAFIFADAIMLPSLVRSANRKLEQEDEEERFIDEEAIAKAESGAADPDARKADHEYVENWIDRLSLLAGEFVSYWAVIAVFVYYFEVLSRYVFNSPTSWAHEAMYLMFGMQYLISGSYAMLTESHVRVDIFYAPLTRPKKAWADLLTSVFFFIFAGTLLTTSYIFAFDAIAVPSGNSVVSDWARGDLGFFQMLGELSLGDWTDPSIRWGEISFNEWEVPLWPMKWMMVVGGILLVLQGVSKIGKDIQAIRAGA